MSVSRRRTTPGQQFQIRVLLENRGNDAYSDLVITIKLPGDIDPVATSANPSAKMVKKTPYIQGKSVSWSKFILSKGKSQRFSVNAIVNRCATQKTVSIKGGIFGNGTLPCEVTASPANVMILPPQNKTYSPKCDGSTPYRSPAFSAPQGILIQDSYLYVVNKFGTYAGTITRCRLSIQGDIYHCVDSGASRLSSPTGIMAAGSYIYVTNSGGIYADTVTRCVVGTKGVLSSCIDAGATGISSPISLALGQVSTNMTYVGRAQKSESDSISKCLLNFDTGVLSDCANAGASWVTDPYGITTQNANVYIVNKSGTSGNKLVKCNSDHSTGSLSGCTVLTVPALNGPTGLAAQSGQLYIVNSDGDSLTKCTIASPSGLLSNCVDAGAALLDTPWALAFDAYGFAYITNVADDSVVRCSGAGGVLSSCIKFT